MLFHNLSYIIISRTVGVSLLRLILTEGFVRFGFDPNTDATCEWIRMRLVPE